MTDSWRSRISSAALSAVNAFFESDEAPFDFSTNESRQAFAEDTLDNLAFLYADTKSSKPKVRHINGL
jgi:hypothetical protein